MIKDFRFHVYIGSKDKKKLYLTGFKWNGEMYEGGKIEGGDNLTFDSEFLSRESTLEDSQYTAEQWEKIVRLYSEYYRICSEYSDQDVKVIYKIIHSLGIIGTRSGDSIHYTLIGYK